MKPVDAAAPSGDFYSQWIAIRDNPNLSPPQRAGAEVQLVERWIPDPKGLGVSLLPHPKDAILPTPLGTFVTKFADVSEVFEQDEVFTVSQGYGQRMAITTGAFMLGMDAGAVYERENSLIRLAMPVSDLPEIRRWIRAYAQGVVDGQAKAGTTIDVAADIGYRVPAAFVGNYFGVTGPNEDTWIGWVQMLAMYIFNFWADISPYKEAAATVGLAYQSYIDTTINQRAAAIATGQNVPDDVLTRMIVKAGKDPIDNLDTIAMRRNLGGLSIGSIIPPSNDIIYALDFIMGLRDTDRATFDIVIRAALDEDQDLLLNCMLEACRLGSPVPPTLFRIAQEDYTVAAGTERATMIPAGTTVVLIPAAAVMDPDVVPEPERFRIDRPARDYMVFGDGMHACLGRAIGEVLLTESARAVFRLPNVRRVDGPAGHIQNGTGLPGGGYPAHLMFAFDPAAGT